MMATALAQKRRDNFQSIFWKFMRLQIQYWNLEDFQIFVGDLSQEVDEAVLEDTFQKFGQIRYYFLKIFLRY